MSSKRQARPAGRGMPPPAETVEAYIEAAPPAARQVLQRLRNVIVAAAPDATECISYGMPAFRLGRVLVYFALHQQHIGFYPTADGMTHFRDRLAAYACSKGAVRFPLDQKVPFELVRRIVEYRVASVLEKRGPSPTRVRAKKNRP